MLSCACTLPYTNPGACKTCPTYLNYYKNYLGNMEPYTVPNWQPLGPTNILSGIPKSTKIKKITKTIKKYDKHNKFIGEKVIIIEEEIFDKSIIDNTGFTIAESSGVTTSPSLATTTKADVPFTYTSNTHEIDNSVIEKSTVSIDSEKNSNNI